MNNSERIQEAILKNDGSCRDINLVSTNKTDVIKFVTWFYENYSSITAHDKNGKIVEPVIYSKLISALQVDNYLHINGHAEIALINDIQLFINSGDNGSFSLEISFFPNDISRKNFNLTDFLKLMTLWCETANASEYFFRYENMSWEYGDTSYGSGVLFTGNNKDTKIKIFISPEPKSCPSNSEP